MNIIITGASRGIGFETAKLLTAEGHKVIAISRHAEKSKLEGVIAIGFDFETGDIPNFLIPEIKKHFQSVDVLINNAATLLNKPFEKITITEFKKVFQVNFFSIIELTQALVPLMLATPPLKGEAGRGSHVVNIASMGGVQGSVKFSGLSAYSSSKGALITLTECLSQEFKDKDIAFNAIAFGAVQTEMLNEAFPGFKAPITANQAAKFLADFSLTGNTYFNGKILQMALSTP